MVANDEVVQLLRSCWQLVIIQGYQIDLWKDATRGGVVLLCRENEKRWDEINQSENNEKAGVAWTPLGI